MVSYLADPEHLAAFMRTLPSRMIVNPELDLLSQYHNLHQIRARISAKIESQGRAGLQQGSDWIAILDPLASATVVQTPTGRFIDFVQVRKEKKMYGALAKLHVFHSCDTSEYRLLHTTRGPSQGPSQGIPPKWLAEHWEYYFEHGGKSVVYDVNKPYILKGLASVLYVMQSSEYGQLTPAQRVDDGAIEKVFREFADDRITLGWDHSNLSNVIDIPWICGRDHTSSTERILQSKVLNWMLEKKVKIMMLTYKKFVNRPPPADPSAQLFTSKEFAALHQNWKLCYDDGSFRQARLALPWVDIPVSCDWARLERWPKCQKKAQRPGYSFAILPGPPRSNI